MPVSNTQQTAVTASMSAEVGATPMNLIRDLKSDDENVRTAAWRAAGDVGAPTVKPLADLMVDGQMEVARAAKRGLWQIVRHCGRPGADVERRAVNKALRGLLSDKYPVALRHEVLWMLSEIGGDDCTKPVASLLSHGELRETARIALERIPGKASMRALESALNSVPENFKPNIAESLRNRGVVELTKIPRFPSAKLTPVKQTSVKPL